MNCDDFLDKAYDLESYNCLHWVRDVWECLTGEDLAARLGDSFETRGIEGVFRSNWTKLNEPSGVCLAVFSRTRKDPKREPYQPSHIGVWCEGLVGHLSEPGARWQELSMVKRGYNKVSFYQ